MTQLRDRVEEVVREECHHFWVIDAASGPTSKGRCKRCGAMKEFFNSFPETPQAPRANVLELPELPGFEFEEAASHS